MMFLRHFRKSYYSAKWPPFVFVKNLIESPGSAGSRDTWLIKYAAYRAAASQNMSPVWDIMWLCPLLYFHFTTTDYCDIVRTNSLLEVVHCVNILQESVIVSFRISISHSWRPGCWEAEKHSPQNISSNGIPDPLKLHICCNYFLIAHLNPHHHICSELCYDSGTRNLIGDEIT